MKSAHGCQVNVHFFLFCGDRQYTYFTLYCFRNISRVSSDLNNTCALNKKGILYLLTYHV